MKFQSLHIAGAYIIHLSPFKDHRGLFERLFSSKELAEIGFDDAISQVNFSHSIEKHTLRGLHFQHPPFVETKIIRCIEGAFFDVIVDIRKDSPTYLEHYSIELKPDVHQMLFIPKGCAHGFQTLQKDSKMLYFHSDKYTPESEDGLYYADPALKIDWPHDPTDISEKDKNYNLINHNFKGI